MQASDIMTCKVMAICEHCIDIQSEVVARSKSSYATVCYGVPGPAGACKTYFTVCRC